MTKAQLIQAINEAIARFIGFSDETFASYPKARLERVYERAQALDALTMEIELISITHLDGLSDMDLLSIDMGWEHPAKPYRDQQTELKRQRNDVWRNGFFR